MANDAQTTSPDTAAEPPASPTEANTAAILSLASAIGELVVAIRESVMPFEVELVDCDDCDRVPGEQLEPRRQHGPVGGRVAHGETEPAEPATPGEPGDVPEPSEPAAPAEPGQQPTQPDPEAPQEQDAPDKSRDLPVIPTQSRVEGDSCQPNSGGCCQQQGGAGGGRHAKPDLETVGAGTR